MVKKWVSILKTVAIPVLTGLLSGFLIRGDVGLYDVLIKPPFSLPGNLFSVVWIVLFVMMGISLYLFRSSDKTQAEASEGILYFFIQLALNFLWPVLFFRFRLFFTAFLLLIFLFTFIILTVSAFYKANRISGLLLILYLLYTAYAGYLNLAIWILNM